MVTISFALVFGLAARQIGLPPLVGFLAAGFGINLLTPTFGLPHYTGEALQHVAHLGVLMLLFTVGLALMISAAAAAQPRWRSIISPERISEPGLTLSCPAYLGAVPWVASKIAWPLS